MATGRHWYSNAIGYFTSGTWVGEMASIGLRGVMSDSGGGDFTQVNQPLPSFTANATGESTEDATFRISYGAIGPVFNKEHQDAIAAAWVTFLGAIKSLQANSFRWEEIRVAAIQANGDYINGATVYSLKTPIVGTQTGVDYGPQVSVVASIRTAGRGPRNRGRMFIPVHKATGTTTGLVHSGTQTTVLNAVDDLRTTLTTPNGWGAAVVSQKWTTYSGITGVRVGDEYDTQQRRRHQRREQYVTT